MGGSDDPSNLVEVTHTQHIMFHFANWQLWRQRGDYIAYKAMSGQDPVVQRLSIASRKEAVWTDERRQKMADSCRSRTGRRNTTETKDKLRSAAANKIRVVCLNNGKVYDSIVIASRETGVPHASIQRCLAGAKNRKGWMFRTQADLWVHQEAMKRHQQKELRGAHHQ
jgi:hypothetical protein